MITATLHKSLNSANGALRLTLDFRLERGAMLTLYGASGAGKTSTLRMLAGLLKPDSGRIVVHNKVWFDSEKGINLPPQERKIGFMFQDYALFPHMSVRKNLEFALAKNADPKMVTTLIEIMELRSLADRKPQVLSGGQKQRVALARSLVNLPELLLLDEPLAALDLEMRRKLQKYLQMVHQKYKLTILLISHDVGEIIKVSQYISKLENGVLSPPVSPTTFFTTSALSGKFQFTAEVITIEKEDILFVVTVLVGTTLTKIVAQASDIKDLHIGDTVIIAAKAFNPVIYKIEK